MRGLLKTFSCAVESRGGDDDENRKEREAE